jgi:hypothetical protein
MILNLRDIKVYIISPGTGKYQERLHTVFNRIVNAGFNRIEFFRSVQCEHIYDSLSLTYIEIFKKELHNSEPFIILEDDCQLWNNYNTIDIPDDYSLLYLGVSKWAYPHHVLSVYFENRPDIVENSYYTVKSINDTLVKVNSMNSSHAIMYKCRNFMKMFIDIYENKIRPFTGIPNDLFYSALIFTFRNDLNAYALKQPMFYQDGTIGGQEEVTKICYDGFLYK